MSDIVILAALIPLAFLVFDVFVKYSKYFYFTSVLIAGAVCLYSIVINSEAFERALIPLAFIITHLTMLLIEKNWRPISLVSMLFLATAFLSKNLNSVLVLILIADSLFLVEDRNEKQLWFVLLSLASLLPLWITTLTPVEDYFKITGFYMTALMRMFSWPLNISEIKIKPLRTEEFILFFKGFSVFVLANQFELGKSQYELLFWLATIILTSVGANVLELFWGICLLSVISNRAQGNAFLLTLPLYYATGLTTSVAGIVGALSFVTTLYNVKEILDPQVLIFVAAMFSVIMARLISPYFLSKENFNRDVILIVLAVVAFLANQSNTHVIKIENDGVLWAALISLGFFVGMFYAIKDKFPKFFTRAGSSFHPMITTLIPDKEKSFTFSSPAQAVSVWSISDRFYEILERGDLILIIVSFVGAFLLWSL